MTEWEIIECFTKCMPNSAPGVVMGPGDDCAVLEKDAMHDWLITTDTLQEGVHFWRSLTTFGQLGWKALAVSLSDINAMGGESKYCMLSVGLPPSIKEEEIQNMSKEFLALAEEAGVTLVGGNTTRTADGIVITTTVLGTVPKGKAILRRGARAGDAIFVTGTFGGAAVGLLCLERGLRGEQARSFIERQLHPCPPYHVGPRLRETGWVTSMIDVSDGLLADLTHIAEASQVGYVFDEARVPTEPSFEEVVRELQGDPIELKLAGGEDYELLFTVRGSDVERFEKCGVVATRVGTIVANPSLRSVQDKNKNEVTMRQRGFDHFAGG